MDDTFDNIHEVCEIDLYEILGLSPDASKAEIKKQFGKLVKKLHPDKPGGDEKKYELVSIAYKILSDDYTRKRYDGLHELTKEKTAQHHELKAQYEDTQVELDPEEFERQKKEKELEFQESWQKMNEKHGFDDEEEEVLTQDEHLTLLEKLKAERDNVQYSIDLGEHVNSNGEFDNDRFNQVFNFVKKQQPNQLLVQDSMVGASNGLALNGGFGTGFNYDQIYTDNPSAEYASLDSAFNMNSQGLGSNVAMTPLDLADAFKEPYVKEPEADLDFEAIMAQRMAEYEQQTERYNNMKVNEFDTQEYHGFGIIDDLLENARQNPASAQENLDQAQAILNDIEVSDNSPDLVEKEIDITVNDTSS